MLHSKTIIEWTSDNSTKIEQTNNCKNVIQDVKDIVNKCNEIIHELNFTNISYMEINL